MPGNILAADTGFPNLNEGSTEQRIEKIGSYLYMLLEQLRYTMSNIGVENFNDAELDGLVEIISKPVSVQLKGLEGQMTQLDLTVEGLNSRVEDAEGQVSQISQTVNGLGLSVSNGQNSSTINLTANGAVLSSQNIQIQGMVTFSNLQDGVTVISGDNLKTGTIRAVNVESSFFRCLMTSGGVVDGAVEMYYDLIADQWLAGGIKLGNIGSGTAESAKYTMNVYTNAVFGTAFALKLKSAGAMSIEASTTIWINSGGNMTIYSYGALNLNATGGVFANGVQIG